MDLKRKSNSKIEEMITDASFLYRQPWFYNHPFALRCELGIGNSRRLYWKNAKRRAYEIFDILFPKSPDAIFFDHYVEDFSSSENIDVKTTCNYFKKNIKFLAQHINKYESVIVPNLPIDEDDQDFFVKKHRIICYTDRKYPYKKRAIENFSWTLKTVHFVSFENECILSIYDDRGCDIVFATQDKLCELYNKLEPYFLSYDLEEMKKRKEK